jgi:hypothetical protein
MEEAATETLGFGSQAEEDPFSMPGAPVFPPMLETTGDELTSGPVDESDPFAMPGAPVFPPMLEITDDGSTSDLEAEDPFAMPGAPVFPAVVESAPQALAPEVELPVERPQEKVMAVPAAAVEPAPVAVAAPAVSSPVSAAPAYEPAALAALASQKVVLRSAEERKNLHAEVNGIVMTLNHQLDEVQQNLASLYAELQKAAVRRAAVSDIVGITEQISRARQRVGQDSEAFKQALYLRQVADAYMALMQDL